MRAAVAVAVIVLLGACGTTVEDRPPADEAGTPISGGVVVDESVPTTVPIEGGPTELLVEMSSEMSRLSSLIGESGADASLARIQEIWIVVRPEIESSHPELVNAIGSTVDMAAVAVETTRPADADKAFGLLTDLVDQYTGDG